MKTDDLDDTPLRRRGRQRLGAIRPGPVVLLMVVWVLLWGKVTVGNIVSGLLVGSLVMATFPLPRIVVDGRPRPTRVLRFAGRFVVDLVTASLQVAWLALKPGVPPSAVVRVGLRARSELLMTVTAEALSLVPGSLVIELRRSDGTLFLHVLGVYDPAGVERARADVLALEARVIRAFGDAEDQRLLGVERAA